MTDYTYISTTNNTSSIFRTPYFNITNYYYKDYNNSDYISYNDYDSYENIVLKQMTDREYAKAYNAGIEEGKDQNIESYFEVFKKLILPYPQGYKTEMIEEIFGTSDVFEIINNYKGKEIINMIKDYNSEI